MNKHLLILIFTLLLGQAFAQNPPVKSTVAISKAKDKIKIDGILDEQTWQEADVAKDFYLAFPVDNDFPTSATEVKMTFDDDFMYFGIVCYDPTPGKYIVESLKRDWDWPKTENISIYIDPFNDRTNGFNFSLSPYNAQREGLIINSEEISSDWDNKWYSRVTNFEDRWVAEIAIPFKTLRYKENLTNWNVQFLRNDVKNNERSAWTAVPQQYRTNNLAFAGKMVWQDSPPPAKNNISVIPYVLGSVGKNHEAGTDYEPDGNIGFDAKIAVSSALNLDLTVNPDFSQVEVDQQVVNLQRFELFFPEKRQFFLENSDLFNQTGSPVARPFFSRRIGIAHDTSGASIAVPIIYGARLSGKLNKDWRIGLMNMQTASRQGVVLPGSENRNNGYNLPGQNYTAAVLQRKIWARSNIGAIFVNRQATSYNASDTTNSTSAYNRVAGLDFNFATLDNKWKSNIVLHGSFDPVAKKNAFSHFMFVGYATRHWNLRYFHSYIGEGFNAEVGFVPRKGVFSAGSFESQYIIYPKTESIVTIKPGFHTIITMVSDGSIADTEIILSLETDFNNTSQLKLAGKQNFTHLFNDFDPTRSGKSGEPLPAGSEYTWYSGSVGYKSDARRALSYEVLTEYGSFYNGQKFTFVSNIGYKFRPYGSFFISAIYNDVQLPSPHNSNSFWLIGPRVDVTFTNSLFLTTFVQYNEQVDNVNINARFQWRFAPVSDLFIVYTDNYFPEDFNVKNRSIVVKLSYWLNL